MWLAFGWSLGDVGGRRLDWRLDGVWGAFGERLEIIWEGCVRLEGVWMAFGMRLAGGGVRGEFGDV